jgi:hypothetical protein
VGFGSGQPHAAFSTRRVVSALVTSLLMRWHPETWVHWNRRNASEDLRSQVVAVAKRDSLGQPLAFF